MLPPKFHSFPFHPFPKENKLGTGGMNEIFISNPPFSLVPGTGGNGWERVNFQGATAMSDFHSGETPNKRFESVWDALPHGLRDAAKSTTEPLSGARIACRPESATKGDLLGSTDSINQFDGETEKCNAHGLHGRSEAVQ